MNKFLVFLLISLFFIACGAKKDSSVDNDLKGRSLNPLAVIKAAPSELLHVAINSMRIEDGVMYLNVSYSGGCEEQSFELRGAELIMKSLPPKRSLVLVRDDKGDACREWITKDLKFDLKPVMLNEDPTQQIIFILSNNQQEIYLINEDM
jgi:hypothetical protein